MHIKPCREMRGDGVGFHIQPAGESAEAGQHHLLAVLDEAAAADDSALMRDLGAGVDNGR